MSNEFKPQTKTINVMLLDGGLGDHIASLVAVKYTLHRYPWVTPLVWVPDYLEGLAVHLLGESVFVKPFANLRGLYQPNRPTKSTKWDGITSPMKTHLLDYAFMKLCDENPSIEHKNYLQLDLDRISILDFVLPKDYVVLTTGYTAEVREFLPKHINEIAKYLVQRNITPVFLGQTQTNTGTGHTIKGTFKEDTDFSLGINLIDKTNLLQAGKIMAKAKAVLGVDNGLMHLAGCTDVPIIGGFTTVHPMHRMPVRNNQLGYNFYSVIPHELLTCRFCQSNTNFLYGHDYRECWFKERKLTDRILCVEQMTSGAFIDHLETICGK